VTATLTRQTAQARSDGAVESVVDRADLSVVCFEPGEAAICSGQVYHRRTRPAVHEFARPVSYVWVDPDHPEQLCDRHPLWSARLPAPARFRRRDYGLDPTGSLADAARDDLATLLGDRPAGPVRMLTQMRRWGWLFNPITVYLVWDDAQHDQDAEQGKEARDQRVEPRCSVEPAGPVGAVLEVSNTPWKERIRYPVALDVADGWWQGRTDKALHVSPFLDEDHRYDVRVRGDGSTIELDVDVVPHGMDTPILRTGLRLEPTRPTRRALGAALRSLSTHRVSFGIHTEALRLWWKRVPFVPHPAKRAPKPSAQSDDDTEESRPVGRGPMSVSAVQSERLMTHAERDAVTRRGPGATVAEWTTRSILRRARHERLTVDERTRRRTGTTVYGTSAGDVDIHAAITVTDERAFAALAREGSIGLGRGFIEGWWTSDDPVAVVQFAIRNLEPLDRLRNRWHGATGWATDRVRFALPRDTRERNRDDIGAHYDIGNEFFRLFLDETMTYSSAVFASPDASLADGSRHKYDLLLDKLGVSAGDHLLEIGSGWGGMAIRAATERDARVTTTTISTQQLDEASRRVASAGVADRVTLLDVDWRDLEGTYDHVVSIEMIEAVDWRDYDDYFAMIERCLRPGGRAAIQAICLPDDRWGRAKNTEDFIRRFVFPNGFLPSVAAIRDSVGRATRLDVVDVDDITPHYAETLRRWRTRFDARLDEVAELGLDERFQRLWRFYLAYCEAGFSEGHIRAVQLTVA
jgi:cyclopropane-fatty-acyl-phospholipid synthase